MMIYIQEQLFDSEEIIKKSMFQCRFFVIHKLMSSCMIEFMFTSNYNYTMDALKNSVSIIKQ